MILELDCGNSAVKWRLRERKAEAGPTRRTALDGLAQALADALAAGAGQARLVSVLGRATAPLCRLLQDAGWSVQVARSRASLQTRHGELRNGYREPKRLGADRWVAMAAAMQRGPGPWLVVDAGTAMTLDLVDAGGVHAGGYIVPGHAVAVDSLHQGTSGVRAAPMASAAAAAAPGRDTSTAVHHGVLRMQADLVAATAARMSGTARVLLTGGGADQLLPLLVAEQVPVDAVPDLVLDGLAVACDA